MVDLARQKAIDLYSNNSWENFLSYFKFWEEPYEVVNKMIPKKGLIVELGCGEGLLTNYLAISEPKRKIIGYELVPERLAAAKKKIKNTTYKVADVTKLKLSKSDIFILFHVLHHLPSKISQEKLLLDIKKVLNKNGKLIIVDVYVSFGIRYLLAWFADHFLVPWVFEKRFYTRAYFRNRSEWQSLLKKIGYKVKTKIETKGRPFPNIIFECTNR
ncbi:MAG: class I SAM-dependent methyltransferase [Candidatus Woesearchaeota archaeon]|jgi:SAM-dependent methyltransferase